MLYIECFSLANTRYMLFAWNTWKSSCSKCELRFHKSTISVHSWLVCNWHACRFFMHVFYIVNVHELCVCQIHTIRWNNRTSINVHQISKCPDRQVLDYISLIKGVCAIGNGSLLYNVWTHTHKTTKDTRYISCIESQI